jgi:hypothetical protein
VADPIEDDPDLLIEEYLDNRMSPEKRKRFEERLNNDNGLRLRLNSTTKSLQLAEQALGWVTPGEEFDEKINTKIVSITQSGQHLQPAVPSSERSLTSNDPDAKLLADPEAVREKQRLVFIAVIAAILFIVAVVVIALTVFR